MCNLTNNQHNRNDSEETRSNVTESSINSEAENEENYDDADQTIDMSLDDENNSRQDELHSSTSHQRNDDDKPVPPRKVLELQEMIIILQLTEAIDKCQAMIRKQRYALRGFHEMYEDVDQLRREYELINAENRMWKADLEREKWMHTQHIRIRMRNNSAPLGRQRSRGSIVLRDLVKNLSMRRSMRR